MSAPYRIRDARPEDMAFAANAWLDSYRVRVFRDLEREIRKLARSTSIRVACDAEDEDTLVGFAARDGDKLHYVYVRQPLRGEGIARELIGDDAVRAYTFATQDGERRLKPAERGWTYEPRIVL